jgi:hypothetical protein
MKFSQISLCAAIAALIEPSMAYPGMGSTLTELRRRISKRDNPVGTNIPLGDLAQGPKTPVGKTILDCFANEIDCYVTDPKVGLEMRCRCNLLITMIDICRPSPAVVPVSRRHLLRLGEFVLVCQISPCSCHLQDYIQKDLVKYFSNSDGTCNQAARAAIRLSFHDAGPWQQGAPYGGADGSSKCAGLQCLKQPPDRSSCSQRRGDEALGKQRAARHCQVCTAAAFQVSLRRNGRSHSVHGSDWCRNLPIGK